MPLWKRLWPQKFKNRLFAAVVLFLLLPFFLVQIYNYRSIEQSVSSEFREKAGDQTEIVKAALTTEINRMFMFYVYLERDSSIHELLTDPGSLDAAETANLFRDKARPQSLELSDQITMTLADLTGQLYENGIPQDAEAYTRFVGEPGFSDLTRMNSDSYRWVQGDILSLYAILLDSREQPFGYLRITFSYDHWFSEASKDLLLQQYYVLMNREGQPISPSDSFRSVDLATVHAMIDGFGSRSIEQQIDYDSSSILTVSYIHNFDWYLIASLPLNTYLGNMKEIERHYFNSYLLLSVILLAVTFLISAAMSRPIALLRRRMAESAEMELNTRLKETVFRGEMRDLAVTFNTMMADIRELVQKLKLEERHKEALHYQMLAAQMNPHFLLNTLNTVKWIALDKGDENISEVCIALGKLLETSLNSDVELIPLKSELELLQAYLYIQNFRYEGKVDVKIEMEEGLTYALVPKLSLQPLMENAMKHGFSELEGNSRVIVRARRMGRSLILELEDNGIGIARAEQKTKLRDRKGIGLANIRQRLRLLFHEDGELTLTESKEGTLARITIPLLISDPYQSGGADHVEGFTG